jgi:hypothetical protein
VRYWKRLSAERRACRHAERGAVDLDPAFSLLDDRRLLQREQTDGCVSCAVFRT